MKKFSIILLLMVLAMSALLISSCSKPTVPNFEELGEIGVPASVWEYEHTVWFDINYVDMDKGSANVNIWMSAKGENPNATLKIVNKNIVFDTVLSYTHGKIYYGGDYELLNMDQPVA